MVYERSGKDAAIDIGVYGGSTVAVPIVSKRWLDMPFCDMVGMATKMIEEMLAEGYSTTNESEAAAVGGLATDGMSAKQIGDEILKGTLVALKLPDATTIEGFGKEEYEKWLSMPGKFRGIGALRPSNSGRLIMGAVKVTDSLWNYITDRHDVAGMVTGVVDLIGGGLGLFNLNPGSKGRAFHGRGAVGRIAQRYHYKPVAVPAATQ